MASRERRIGNLGENDSGVLLPLYEAELDELQRRIGANLSRKYLMAGAFPATPQTDQTYIAQLTTRLCFSMPHFSFEVTIF